MSKRPLIFIYILIVIAAWVGCVFVIAIASPPVKSTASQTSSFHSVDDRPIVETLDQYYELVQTGRTAITIDGRSYWIFWGDFSPEEKQKLQLRLRTP